MLSVILDHMAWFLKFLIAICLMRLSYYLCFFAGNKIWELIYKKDNHGKENHSGGSDQ